VWLGFWTVEVAPSPKFQAHEVMVDPPLDERSVNVTARGTKPLVWLAEKIGGRDRGRHRDQDVGALGLRVSADGVVTESETV